MNQVLNIIVEIVSMRNFLRKGERGEKKQKRRQNGHSTHRGGEGEFREEWGFYQDTYLFCDCLTTSNFSIRFLSFENSTLALPRCPTDDSTKYGLFGDIKTTSISALVESSSCIASCNHDP